MSPKIEIHSDTARKLEGDLKAILYLLQSNLEDFKAEVDRSYSLLKIGERTDFVKSIESSLRNPLFSISEMSKNLDDNVTHIVDGLVKSFLVYRREFIQRALRSRTTMNDLHYSIVLKEDRIEIRDKFLDFFEYYDLYDISRRYPVTFQFVPPELIDKIRYTEEIEID